jgi:uncharacterized protein with gpF-like domain
MAKQKITADPTAPTRIKTAAENEVARSIADAFNDAYDEIEDDVIEQFERQTTAEQIIEMLTFDSYDTIAHEIQNPLEATFGDAGEDAVDKIQVHVDTDLPSEVFDMVNDDAKDYAQSRSAELVGRKWVNGELVDNPDADWAITETTRDGLRSLIERAYSEGFTPDRLKREIQASYGFSKDRAKMIAKTEMNRASSQGALAGWKRSGVVSGKEWIISDDHDEATADCDCGDNADAGVVPIDDAFPSGDDGPPNHPNCNCSMAATLSDDE